MRVTGLFHATLTAWDIERAETFYREVLGIQRHALPSYFPGDVVFLDLGNAMVHLVKYGAPLSGAMPLDLPDEESFFQRQRENYQLRTHIAIEVDDLDDAFARVSASGRPIIAGPLTRADGMRCFYFSDTEFNRVELVQH